jgi:hypothetical protein
VNAFVFVFALTPSTPKNFLFTANATLGQSGYFPFRETLFQSSRFQAFLLYSGDFVQGMEQGDDIIVAQAVIDFKSLFSAGDFRQFVDTAFTLGQKLQQLQMINTTHCLTHPGKLGKKSVFEISA